MSKQAQRAAVRAAIAALDPAARAGESAGVVARLRGLLPDAGLVAAYVARPDEVDLGPLIAELAAAGRLVLPRVAGDALELVRVRDLGALVRGPLQLQEPSSGDLVAPEALAAVVVPGRAFDREGRRLGRGKGYYDRLLPRVAGPKLGVAFSVQVVDEVVVDPWDWRVDAVVAGGTRAGRARQGSPPRALP